MNPQSPFPPNTYTLRCRMASESAALERLCQVVRIRGFRINRMAVENAGSQLDIQLTLEGSRPIAMLESQLEKLHSVTDVVRPRKPTGFSARATPATG